MSNRAGFLFRRIAQLVEHTLCIGWSRWFDPIYGDNFTEHLQSFNVVRTGRVEEWSRKARPRSNAALPIGDVRFES